MSNALARGRESYSAGAWGDAAAQLATAQAEQALELDDLERLGLAAYLAGSDDTATDAWSRAHQAALHAGDRRRAARQAILIASGLDFRGQLSPAAGWYARAERDLEGVAECSERALLRAMAAMDLVFAGDHAQADPVLARSEAVSRQLADADAFAMSRLGLGMSHVMQGRLQEGMALLDEVMAAVTSGEVSPVFAGIAYCATIGTCAEAFDLRRAREWTAALTRWCEAQPDLVPYRGNCLVHRSEIMQLQGAWPEALDAAEEACERLSRPVRWDTLGSAYYQLGELRRLRGEFAEAEDSFARARAAGREPEPGMALLRLAQGRVESAVAVIRRLLDETVDPAARSRVLPAAVEVLLTAGDGESARLAGEELAEIAALLDAPLLHAIAADATGAVHLAEGDASAALPRLRAAAAAWRDLEAPYERARVQVRIGLACRALGDAETARLELESARKALQELGATPDVQRLDVLLSPATGAARGGLTPRELEVLRHLACGLTNRAIANELVLSERTVARHVSNIFTKIHVPSRAAATAYAYEHSLV